MQGITIKTVPRRYTNESAIAMVAMLNDTEDACGWEYRAIPDPTYSGLAWVVAYDEDGEEAGRF